MDGTVTLAQMETAMRNYENMKKASRAYWERKKQKRIEDGTYRGRGRPRKNVPTDDPPNIPEAVAVAVASESGLNILSYVI